MASPDGQTPDSLIAKLAEKPHAYNFYAAVRLLQSCFRSQPRIGCVRVRHRWNPQVANAMPAGELQRRRIAAVADREARSISQICEILQQEGVCKHGVRH